MGKIITNRATSPLKRWMLMEDFARELYLFKVVFLSNVLADKVYSSLFEKIGPPVKEGEGGKEGVGK